jgi:hypothetical protein
MADDLDRQLQVGHHPPDHLQLLPVLLPEHREVRLDLVEQDVDDGGDALEMPRPEDRKSTRVNSSHNPASRMPSSA